MIRFLNPAGQWIRAPLQGEWGGHVVGVTGAPGLTEELLSWCAGLSTPKKGSMEDRRKGEVAWVPREPAFPNRTRVGEWLELFGRSRRIGDAERSALAALAMAWGPERSVNDFIRGEARDLMVAASLAANLPHLVVSDLESLGPVGGEPASVALLRWSVGSRDRTLIYSTTSRRLLALADERVRIEAFGFVAEVEPLPSRTRFSIVGSPVREIFQWVAHQEGVLAVVERQEGVTADLEGAGATFIAAFNEAMQRSKHWQLESIRGSS